MLNVLRNPYPASNEPLHAYTMHDYCKATEITQCVAGFLSYAFLLITSYPALSFCCVSECINLLPPCNLTNANP